LIITEATRAGGPKFGVKPEITMPKKPNAYIFGRDPPNGEVRSVTVLIAYDTQKFFVELDLGKSLTAKNDVGEAATKEFRNFSKIAIERAKTPLQSRTVLVAYDNQKVLLDFGNSFTAKNDVGEGATNEFRNFANIVAKLAETPLQSPWP
jgi:hypothetical protein